MNMTARSRLPVTCIYVDKLLSLMRVKSIWTESNHFIIHIYANTMMCIIITSWWCITFRQQINNKFYYLLFIAVIQFGSFLFFVRALWHKACVSREMSYLWKLRSSTFNLLLEFSPSTIIIVNGGKLTFCRLPVYFRTCKIKIK